MPLHHSPDAWSPQRLFFAGSTKSLFEIDQEEAAELLAWHQDHWNDADGDVPCAANCLSLLWPTHSKDISQALNKAVIEDAWALATWPGKAMAGEKHADRLDAIDWLANISRPGSYAEEAAILFVLEKLATMNDERPVVHKALSLLSNYQVAEAAASLGWSQKWWSEVVLVAVSHAASTRSSGNHVAETGRYLECLEREMRNRVSAEGERA